jgi:hypothetical protein
MTFTVIFDISPSDLGDKARKALFRRSEGQAFPSPVFRVKALTSLC